MLGLSAIGRRTSSFKQPQLGLPPLMPPPAAVDTADAGADLAQVTSQLREIGGAGGTASIGSVLTVIAAALQQCGKQLMNQGGGGSLPPDALHFDQAHVPGDLQGLEQEVRGLRAENAALKLRAQQWESERGKLHACIDHFRRRVCGAVQQAAPPSAEAGPRDATARLRAAARMDTIDGMDTDRSTMSDGADAWVSQLSHRPVKSRPHGVPAINLAALH